MSYQLDTTINNLRAQATTIRENYGHVVQDTLKNATLSTVGKKQAIQKELDAITTKLNHLRDQEDAAFNAELERIERSLNTMSGIGIGSDIIAFRDAQDRAESIDNGNDALTIMKRAISSGDKTLATAIATRAVERAFIDLPWEAVVNAYAEAHPSTAKLFQERINIARNMAGDNTARWIYIAPSMPSRV